MTKQLRAQVNHPIPISVKKAAKKAAIDADVAEWEFWTGAMRFFLTVPKEFRKLMLKP